ncbi:hypothetical protein DITRI_Ditri17bG0080800 [Diplodiscus trichospermus]
MFPSCTVDAGDYWLHPNGSHRGLKLAEFYGLDRDGYIGVRRTLHSATRSNYSESRASGMEYESDWTKHRVSSAFTVQVIRSATSLMPWCCKIPIGDGFHEFF